MVQYESEQGVSLTENADTLIDNKLTNFFSYFDRRKIRNAATSNSMTPYDGNVLAILYGLFFSFLLLAIPMSPQFVPILGTYQPAGILLFPLTFIMIDTINEVFGYRFARRLCITAAFVMVIASAGTAITANYLGLKGAYLEVFGKLPKLYLINAACILVADQLNNKVFSLLKVQLTGAHLWLRCLVSTVVGQVMYTVIWITLFFGSDVNAGLIQKIIDNYGFKIGYAACLIPVTYTLVFVIRRLKK